MERHTSKFLDEIKIQLNLEAQEIRTRLNSVIEDNDEKLVDETDIATQGQQKAFDQQLRNRDLLYLSKVGEALKKVDHGSYGICRFCEELIPEARLKARPTADAHVDCKEDEEAREKQKSGNQRVSTSAKLTFGN